MPAKIISSSPTFVDVDNKLQGPHVFLVTLVMLQTGERVCPRNAKDPNLTALQCILFTSAPTSVVAHPYTTPASELPTEVPLNLSDSMRRWLYDSTATPASPTSPIPTTPSEEAPCATAQTERPSPDSFLMPASAELGIPTEHELEPLLEQIQAALRSGTTPQLCSDGVGGTYFLSGPSSSGTRSQFLAVFKPVDEEACAANNPRTQDRIYDNNGSVRGGIEVGKAAVREVAAYLVDHEHYAGVPPTTLVRIRNRPGWFHNAMLPQLDSKEQLLDYKYGSLQQYVTHDGCAEDFGCSRFLPADVHKIGLLDLRILNADRHAGNILVVTSPQSNSHSAPGARALALVPIDHGFCFPELLDEDLWFEWMNWPQARKPFDEATREYALNIVGRSCACHRSDCQHSGKVDADCALLRRFGMSTSVCRLYRASCLLVRLGLEAGLTLREMGALVCPSVPGGCSVLSQAYSAALRSQPPADPGNDALPAPFHSLLAQHIHKKPEPRHV